jgi:predicted metal-dependent phosphoesterase TrpH/glycosyltransferase involved in cell wall biosynthesis
VPRERLSIAQVTPYPWEQQHEVNHFVERLSQELRARGHRVVVVAPSDSRDLVRDGRRRVKAVAGGDPDALFAGDVLAVGQSLPFRRGGSVSLPIDVSRTLEDLLDHALLDVLHVHEPFAPSTSSAALRHSRALNVGTFHSPTERFVSTQVARPLVELLFGRLDGRSASFAATRDLVERFFPGGYDVIRPGADLLDRAPRSGPPEILFPMREERGALRILLRALRRMDTDRDWHATVWFPEPAAVAAPPALPRRLRERVHFAGPQEGTEAEHLQRADVVVAASSGTAPAPQLLLRALGAGAVPVASRLPRYEESLDDGELGLLFEPRDSLTLAAQLDRLVADPELLTRLRGRVEETRESLSWSRTADSFEELYAGVVGRRHDSAGDAAARKRLASRDLISVDLHMHTNHSPDCATPADTLLAAARDAGLGAIAVTDHNEVSGAHEARAKAEQYGVKVIVAEEVKTADQGEVIALFIEDKIPRGMTLQETIAAIRDQGGLVYVPHPFDRMHSVPDYEHLLDVVEDIDAIEVFNPRVAFSSFNEEAERFAAKYRIVAGAGSDSHVAAGLGSVKIRMRDFDGPEEFLESLRDADIVRRKTSLLYVQALKFIQTKATPETARRRTARPGAGQTGAGGGGGKD